MLQRLFGEEPKPAAEASGSFSAEPEVHFWGLDSERGRRT